MHYLLALSLFLFAPVSWSEETVSDNNCIGKPSAKLVSLQGNVFFDPDNKGHWQRAQLNEAICEGSRVRVAPFSRASLMLPDSIVLRLDEGTVLSLNGINPDKPTLLDLLKGFVNFISRTPRRLQVNTPIANAGPEGTEFALSADDTKASLWVYEGKVRFFNEQGSIRINPGQGAQVYRGQAPQAKIDIKPQDAVAWALYYPPLLPYPDDKMAVDAGIRTAIGDFRQRRVDAALSRLDALSPEQRTPYFYKIRGAIRLAVGRVELALQDIQALLADNPNDAEALALQSVLALTQNRKDEAHSLASRAVVSDPNSATAYAALSYAEQGRFELEKALKAAGQAMKLAPHDAMVWARKSELELALGLLAESEKSAEKALDLDAGLERTQTVAGFAYLRRMDTDKALQTFTKAVQLDSTSPLARLGLGLAKIRKSDLKEGRQDLEIAAMLDPNNSLLRSYLGKGYFEEKRNALAEDQFSLAKERDPNDPTPYFYDAMKKQTENRPVEALQDLQQAMALNDNRAVYRSRELLDSDRAARGASLARVYDDLGFEQRGVVEAITSLQTDPTNYSAHRFLSDTYVNQSSRETAQLSELLQAKLLQPININPVQPHLSVSQRGLLSASDMANSSFQDFTRNFERNRPQLIASGVVGNMGTYSDEVTLSGLLDKFSYSLGQYHYRTDGFTRASDSISMEEERHNTDQRHDIYDAFFQAAVNDRLNAQFEYVYRDTEQGDFRQDLITKGNSYLERARLRENIYRAGLNIRFFTDDHLLVSYVHADSSTHKDPFGASPELAGLLTADTDSNSDLIEGQYLRHSEFYNVITGFSFYSITEKEQIKFGIDVSRNDGFRDGRNGSNQYAYLNLKLPYRVTGTLGLSNDYSHAKDQKDKLRIYPKVGLMWDMNDKAKLRLAYFSGKKRPLAAVQSIEPTQIAGFNQFFDDFAGYSFSFYGGALDFVIQPTVFAGLELSQRDVFDPLPGALFTKQDSAAVYLNWAALDRFSISTRYRYTYNKYPHESIPLDKLFTHSVPLEFRYFDPSGFFSKLTGTYISQETGSCESQDPTCVYEEGGDNKESSSFFLLDAAIGYRLPKRLGIVSLEGKNLLNKKYRFDDMSRVDSSNIFFNASEFIPQRAVFGRIVLNF
ncbi:FecR domain-containing protein [Methylobacter sp. BlB1]|uniref:FecR domain-containing protein n=1 Tax=Methylobacter sp. BlB1 TaxID=2785914 RepID=UPI001892ECC6|nr:FecR domain-containing protein [Methylobacter sp. BlB1]MBF6648064.1 FecR domain-containing protein [Methylobacter sp. BlB1]